LDDPVRANVIPKPDPNSKNNPEWLAGVEKVYGFDAWPTPQPAQLPKDTHLAVAPKILNQNVPFLSNSG